MRALVLWLLLLAPAFVDAQTDAAQAALDAIAACEEAAGDASGDVVVAELCPDLEQALEDAEYSAFVSFAQRDELTADSLSDLHALIARYERPHASANVPDPRSLPAILGSLDRVQQPEPPLSWWERLRRWLREQFVAGEEGDTWLTRWLERFELDPTVAETIVFGCIVLVIVLALVVLINELRVAGVFRRGGTPESKAHGAAVGRESSLSWSDLERIAPADRPSFVLRMLVAALVRAGRLRTERSLTHREITARALLDDDAQRAILARVAMLAEKMVYGGATSDADADVVIAQGRELHARLSARA